MRAPAKYRTSRLVFAILSACGHAGSSGIQRTPLCRGISKGLSAEWKVRGVRGCIIISSLRPLGTLFNISEPGSSRDEPGTTASGSSGPPAPSSWLPLPAHNQGPLWLPCGEWLPTLPLPLAPCPPRFTPQPSPAARLNAGRAAALTHAITVQTLAKGR